MLLKKGRMVDSPFCKETTQTGWGHGIENCFLEPVRELFHECDNATSGIQHCSPVSNPLLSRRCFGDIPDLIRCGTNPAHMRDISGTSPGYPY